jgi:hypothetical protein
MQLQLGVNQLYIPNYDEEKSKCTNFLTTFEDASIEQDSIHGKQKYMIEMVTLSFI